MLVWYRPKPNEVNFLPWLEHYIEWRRRKRLFLYSSALVVIMFGLAAFGLLYFNLLQLQANVQRQVLEELEQLRAQQQRLWSDSLERRLIERDWAMQAQQEFNAWLPMQELSRLLMMLEPQQQLVSWQWQPTNSGQQVVFTVMGHGQWQRWWQDALKVWPSIHMEALGPEGDGWKFEARYLLVPKPLSVPSHNVAAVPASQSFALQLTPQPLSVGVGVEVEPIASMIRQVAKYGQGVEVVRGQGMQIKMRLDFTQWASLAPLPSASGWRLQGLSIQQTPTRQWQVSMQWLSDSDILPSYYMLRLAPTAAVKTKIHRSMQNYAQAFQTETLPTQTAPAQKLLVKINPVPDKLQLANSLQFIGHSQQQGHVPVAWIKSLPSGRLLRAELGHQIDGWCVSFIGAQGVHLTQGQQVIILERRCLAGVCRK